MITVLIAGDEKKVKEMITQMLDKHGNLNLDIVRQENIVKIVKNDDVRELITLKDKIIELEDSLYKEKQGELYKSILEVIEKPLIEHTLERTEGNQLKAARILGLNRNTIRTKIKKLGINPDKYKTT
jgi:DNA-binding protein Fis